MPNCYHPDRFVNNSYLPASLTARPQDHVSTTIGRPFGRTEDGRIIIRRIFMDVHHCYPVFIMTVYLKCQLQELHQLRQRVLWVGVSQRPVPGCQAKQAGAFTSLSLQSEM